MTTNTTADKGVTDRYRSRRKGPNWGLLLMIAVGLHVVGIGALWQLGFFNTPLSVDKEEAKRMAEDAVRRNQERKERERKEREQRKLRPEDQERLEEFERDIARKNLLDYVEELQRIDEEMLEIKEESLDELEARDDGQYRRFLAKEILRLSRELEGDLTNWSDPDFRRFAQTETKGELQEPLGKLVRAAESVVGKPGDSGRLGELVRQADVNADNMQRLVDAAPPDKREPEERAKAAGEEIERLSQELAGLRPLDGGDYRDTAEGRSELDPSLRPEGTPQMTPEDLLALAQRIEESINGNFDDLRASQLARQLNLPLSQAQDGLIPSEVPERVSPQFPSNPQTFEALQALQDALQQAADQAGQITDRASQQLAAAQGMEGPPGQGSPGQAPPGQRGQPGMPGQFPGQGRMPGMGGGMGSNPYAMGFGPPGSSPQRLDLRQNLDLTPPGSSPERSGGGSDDGRNQIGNVSEGGQSMIAGKKLPEVDLEGREDFIHANALPGHRFSRDSDRSGWVYLNTFYTIGPWDNRGSINWDKLHGPDPQPFMNVDLYAIYTDGRKTAVLGSSGTLANPERTTVQLDGKLRWRFVQTDSIQLTFPDEYWDSTYYAYTEIHFEEEMDMDVLIASDDATTAWISNSHPAYNQAGNCFRFHTEDDLSSWKLGEARKRMRFTKGLNRILIRLENGPSFARLSVLLSPVGAMDGSR